MSSEKPTDAQTLAAAAAAAAESAAAYKKYVTEPSAARGATASNPTPRGLRGGLLNFLKSLRTRK